jgi:hypothetical protein
MENLNQRNPHTDALRKGWESLKMRLR